MYHLIRQEMIWQQLNIALYFNLAISLKPPFTVLNRILFPSLWSKYTYHAFTSGIL